MVSGEDFPNKANQTSRIFPASLPSSLDKGLTIGRADRTNAVLKKTRGIVPMARWCTIPCKLV